MGSIDVRTLGADDLDLIGEIDRSEHVEVEYTVVDGRIVERPVTMADVPQWDPVGAGEYSVAAKIEFCRLIVERGGAFLGAFDEGCVMGVAVIEGSFEPGIAWFAFLFVSRPYRRRGVASALWEGGVKVARDAGAKTMYVSATPSGSAVGFYLSRGCVLAEPVHAGLYELEPDDIHLVCELA
jgi:GNAT superfamily N-acetyltransferase